MGKEEGEVSSPALWDDARVGEAGDGCGGGVVAGRGA